MTGELVLLGLIALLLTVRLALLLPIISLYGAQVLMVDKITVGVILAIAGGITAVALLPAGHLADRLGRKRPIVAGLVILTACFGGAPLTSNLLVVTAGATLAGLGYALAVPAWNALAMDRIAERSRGCSAGSGTGDWPGRGRLSLGTRAPLRAVSGRSCPATRRNCSLPSADAGFALCA
jgi:MFS family permease